jgi:hypothetical protein
VEFPLTGAVPRIKVNDGTCQKNQTTSVSTVWHAAISSKIWRLRLIQLRHRGRSGDVDGPHKVSC